MPSNVTLVQSPALPHSIKMNKSVLLSIAVFFAFSFAVAIAQETEETSTPPSSNVDRLTIETKDKEEKEKDRNNQVYRGLKLEQKFQRRLPNNFAALVTPAQRDQIYKLQEEYFETLALLELRVELLKKERDAKIDAVLTSEQLQRLNRPARILPILSR